ncbi:MAG: hypothetical protein R3B67_13245 [Phycisphaerales bacterium]
MNTGLIAQSINFETLPDGTPTTDQQLISDQYVADFGVRFDLVDPMTLEVVGSPQIAKVARPVPRSPHVARTPPTPARAWGSRSSPTTA